MDEIKEAFLRVKKDMISIKKELENLKKELNSLKLASTQNTEKTAISTDTSTLRQEIEGLKPQNLGISIGNEGVPTDRQTDRQTDQHIVIPPKIPIKPEKPTFEQASEILETLDNIKKEIRLKFKRLTPQEMLIFSTLYQLEQTQKEVNYKDISLKLNLSESSIRDYVSRLINKGIPVEKIRKNNKQIILKISEDLRKIASLQTIIQLRDL